MWQISKLEKGQRPTLLETDLGNQVIDAINALGNLTIEGGQENAVQYSSNGIKILYKFPPDGWELKEIEICEAGESVTHQFLVRTLTSSQSTTA
tara:strand:+ start:374 stop:655 length:282 start_codon:yes stop_codon:yes gene_type:complete